MPRAILKHSPYPALGQSILCGVVGKLLAVVSADTISSVDPQMTRIVFQQRDDLVVCQPVLCGESGKVFSVVSADAIYSADPQITFSILDYVRYRIAWQAV